jgi:hypothetical protein
MSLYLHSEVTPARLESQLQRLNPIAAISPELEVYQHTLALWSTFRDYGCLARLDEATEYTSTELVQQATARKTVQMASRGATENLTCCGRLRLLQFNNNLVVRCVFIFLFS